MPQRELQPTCGHIPDPMARQARLLALLTTSLLLLFSKPLYNLFAFSLHSQLFSHIFLVPFISGYLVFLKKHLLRTADSPSRGLSFVPASAAIGVMLLYEVQARHRSFANPEDPLAWTTLSFVLFFLWACQFALGKTIVRGLAFPLGFLVFMVPFPGWMTGAIESFLQYASAMGAQVLFSATGMPVIRDGLRFLLPGMRLEVAPECSGIHSTLVLFITSVIAAHLFLRSPWKRLLLCLAVIPLGILRNAIRIWVIGNLCVHIGPQMIDSAIHRRGGPLFFAGSLVPFFLLVWALRRSDSRAGAIDKPNPEMQKLRQTTVLLICSALVMLCGSGCTKELRTRTHLTKADALFASQKYDAAEIEYLKVLQLVPSHPRAILQLGTIYQEEGKWPRGYAFLRKSLELEPENVQSHLQMGLTYFALQDRKQAAKEASWILDKEAGQPEALALYVDSCVGAKEVQDALAKLAKMNPKATGEAAFHAAMSTLYLKQQDLTNADSQIQQALVAQPGSPAAQIALANLCWIRNDLTNADRAFQAAAQASPLRSSRRLTYAEFKLRTGAVEEAKKILHSITEPAPDYLPAWNLLAEIALAQKDYENCNDLIQRVLARNGSNFNALLLLGGLRLAKGDFSQAIADYERMVAIYDRSPVAQFQLARAYLINGDPAKAVPHLNLASSLDPNFVDPILLLANINLRKGRPLEAIASLKDVLTQHPELAQVYLLLANAYLLNNDLPEAVNVCRLMESRFSKSPEVPLVLGTVLVKQHRNDEARLSFQRALDISTNFFPALEQLVDLDLAEKQPGRAIQRVQAQIQSNPKAAELWLLLAKAHTAKAESYVPPAVDSSTGKPVPKLNLSEVPAASQDVVEAETALLKAIKINPGLRNSYFMLASLYVESNRQQQALERLYAFLSSTNDASARMQVGIIQDRLKNYPAAKEEYEKVLAINPNFSLALNNLAYLYSERLGDLQKAYDLAEKARRLLPNDAPTADTLGWILLKRGEYTRAVGLIEESAARLPNDPEIQFHLGMAHYMEVEEAPARVALQAAVNGTADFSGKDEAKKKLAILNLDVTRADASSVAELNKYLRENAKDPIAFCRLAAIQLREGMTNEAVQTYETALKCSPQSPEILLRLAQLYATPEANNDRKAFDLAKSAHSLAPDDARISVLLGRLALGRGDSPWAISLLEYGARGLDGNAQANYELAWAYYSMGRIADAISAMGKVAEMSGKSGNLDAARFLQLVDAGQQIAPGEAAVAAAEGALIADPDYVPALMVTAVAQQQKGRVQEAATRYESVLRKFPLFTPACRNLAILYAMTGDRDQAAFDLATKARKADPNDAQLGRALGLLEYRRKNYNRAAELLRQYSTVGVPDPEVFYYLGMAQYRLKAKSESKTSLERSLALNVRPKLADEARRVLLELK
jgi:exosortase C (VPDSG-CTERM-specific)